MSTKNLRINLSFEEETFNLISFMANQQHKSLAGFVKELAMETLNRLEDKKLSELAMELDNPDVKIYNHLEAWK